MKIGLIGYLGFGNYGDELFIETIKNRIDNNEISCERVNTSIESPFFNEERLKIFDAFIIVGGDILNPSIISDLYWNKLYLNAKKPIYIYNLGYPNWISKSDTTCEYYKKFFEDSIIKRIHTRDNETSKFIKENISDKIEIITTPDTTISNFINFKKINNDEKILCVNLRNPYSFEYQYSNLIYLIDKLKSKYTIKLLVAGIEKIGIDDLRECEKLSKLLEMNNIKNEIISPNSISEITEFIKKCEIIITNKFHVFVVGNCLSIKTISISGNNKFVNFAKSFNITSKLIPIENLDIENIESDLYIDRDYLTDQSLRIKKTIKQNLMGI